MTLGRKKHLRGGHTVKKHSNLTLKQIERLKRLSSERRDDKLYLRLYEPKPKPAKWFDEIENENSELR